MYSDVHIMIALKFFEILKKYSGKNLLPRFFVSSFKIWKESEILTFQTLTMIKRERDEPRFGRHLLVRSTGHYQTLPSLDPPSGCQEPSLDPLTGCQGPSLDPSIRVSGTIFRPFCQGVRNLLLTLLSGCQEPSLGLSVRELGTIFGTFSLGFRHHL